MQHHLKGARQTVAFSVGLIAAAVSGSAWVAHAAPFAGEVSQPNADMNVVSAASLCVRTKNSLASPVVQTNGVRNTQTQELQMTCPLTSPSDGFDDENDHVAIDVLDMSTVAPVMARACVVLRESVGQMCNEWVWTDPSGTGPYGISMDLPYAFGDPSAARSIEVSLPGNTGTGASRVRAFGYDDSSAGDVDSAIDELYSGIEYAHGRIDSVESSASATNDNLTSVWYELDDLDDAIDETNDHIHDHTDELEYNVARLQEDVSALNDNFVAVNDNLVAINDNLVAINDDINQIQNGEGGLNHLWWVLEQIQSGDGGINDLWSSLNSFMFSTSQDIDQLNDNIIQLDQRIDSYHLP